MAESEKRGGLETGNQFFLGEVFFNLSRGHPKRQFSKGNPAQMALIDF